jgi:hypothetical protein
MFKSLTAVSVACTAVLATMAISAYADTVYLASSFETLYRVKLGEDIESWDFPGIKLRGMHYDPGADQVFGLGDDGGDSAPATVYTLQNPVDGTPALVAYSQLSHHYGSLTQIGDTFYGFSHADLYGVDLSDPAYPVETYVGTTGVLGAAGAAYDPVSGTLYMMSYKEFDDALYTVDPDTAAATLVGYPGIDAYDLGAEWFDGGLFAAVQNGSTGYFEIGEVSAVTGHYSVLTTVASGADYVATGLTVIPEPTSLALLLAGCLGLLRRRS